MSVYAKSKHGGRRVWQPPQMTDEERLAREKAWASTIVAPSNQPEPKKRVPPLSANFVPASAQAAPSPTSESRSAAADTVMENILTAAGAWERAWRQTQSASSRSRGQTTPSVSTASQASHTRTTSSSSSDTASTVIETGDNYGPSFSAAVPQKPGPKVQQAAAKEAVPAPGTPPKAAAPLEPTTVLELDGVSKLRLTDEAHGAQQTTGSARTRLALLESLEKLGEQALRRRYTAGSVQVKDGKPAEQENSHGKGHEEVEEDAHSEDKDHANQPSKDSPDTPAHPLGDEAAKTSLTTSPTTSPIASPTKSDSSGEVIVFKGRPKARVRDADDEPAWVPIPEGSSLAFNPDYEKQKSGVIRSYLST
ncbi:hypothetical protein W97_07543 [Coniosporium apollinis CBS 100218]|uniref:Uncharacterized protein n=1 Tax=Coniosporium apollinis (strain CBS 100218) TaxID=1168221 RepID=R7Z260_CONA1|nr:uncharacterized protein W97_07543 [Coniosporium apollinis CBS 100218]EON68285.1 hypothetical protein W97_07543 [Coniosporium apollinis CBS 100218]